LWLYLIEKTTFFKEQHKVLHIAPELCFMERFKGMDNLDYTTGDLESPLADVKMDIQEIPFDENTFDVVFCNHVMEHVDDDIKAMREIQRVLNPGGWAIIQVPFFYPLPENTLEDAGITGKKEREEAFGQDDHVRKYGLDYADRLRSAGFEVNENNFVSTLTEEQQKRFSVPSNEIVYHCFKSLASI
jgi:SAM-dependent methyltransferase